MVQDSDIYCFRGYCYSNNTATKAQIQGTTVKDYRLKEAKTKDPKPTSSRTNVAKPLKQEKKNQKDTKKKF